MVSEGPQSALPRLLGSCPLSRQVRLNLKRRHESLQSAFPRLAGPGGSAVQWDRGAHRGPKEAVKAGMTVSKAT